MQLKPIIRKLAADTVPYGDAITTRGNYVWGAFDGDELVAIGATVDEAKRKYRRVWAESMTKRSGQAEEGRGGGDANLYSESP